MPTNSYATNRKELCPGRVGLVLGLVWRGAWAPVGCPVDCPLVASTCPQLLSLAVALSCCQLVAVAVNRASNHWAAAAAEAGKEGRTRLALEEVGWGTRDGYGYWKLAAAACYPVQPGARRRCCQLIDFSLQRASLETGSQSWCRCQCVWPHLLIFFVAHLPAGVINVISVNKDLSACAISCVCVCVWRLNQRRQQQQQQLWQLRPIYFVSTCRWARYTFYRGSVDAIGGFVCHELLIFS